MLSWHVHTWKYFFVDEKKYNCNLKLILILEDLARNKVGFCIYLLTSGKKGSNSFNHHAPLFYYLWCISCKPQLHDVSVQSTHLSKKWGHNSRAVWPCLGRPFLPCSCSCAARDVTGNDEDPVPWGPGHFFTPRFPRNKI